MKLGKIGKINQASNAKLKKMFTNIGITSCENCGSTYNLGFAHRHKRVWYRGKPELLSSFNQVILLCNFPCHDGIEYDRDATEAMFMRLRGEED